jgi:transposase InsO family protein
MWMTFYNHRRPHAAHGGETPVRVYRDRLSVSGPGLRPDFQPTASVA